MEPVISVANYFIRKGIGAMRPITPMKLQKLVYFAHGWYLAIKGDALINDPVEAWKYGPVIPSIYHAFKRYGNDPITALEPNGFGKIEITSNAEIIKILDLVWESYSGLSPIQLSNLTHEINSPWHKTLNPYLEKGIEIPRGKDISEELIKTYFSGKLAAA